MKKLITLLLILCLGLSMFGCADNSKPANAPKDEQDQELVVGEEEAQDKEKVETDKKESEDKEDSKEDAKEDKDNKTDSKTETDKKTETQTVSQSSQKPAESTQTKPQQPAQNEKPAEPEKPASPAFSSLSDLVTKIYDNTKDFEIRVTPTTQISLTDTDKVKYYLGLDSAANISEAAYSETLIGSIAYSLCVVKVKDASASTVASAMRSGVDPRKWICVEAESVFTSTYGDYVLLVMADSTTANNLYQAFKTVTNNGCSARVDR